MGAGRIHWIERASLSSSYLLGGIAMPEKVMPGPVEDSCGIREAVCIHTRKIFDSCRDKDCIEDLRFYPKLQCVDIINRALSVKGGSAKLLYVYVDVEPVSFNRGFYTVDMRFFYHVTLQAYLSCPVPVTVEGLCVFDKRAILFGSEGNAKIFSSEMRAGEPDPQMMQRSNTPIAVVEAVDIPGTVKTRLGWDEGSKVIVDLAESLQDCGIRALTIHGRTRAQMYTGEADWTLIGEVKNNPRMTIPIIGNGDITSPERARECFDRYGVDAVMVGRATFGRPWIFKEIMDVLNPESVSVAHEAVKSGYPVMSADWKIDVLKEQVLTSVRRIDEYRGILHSRRHLAASPVFKGIPNFRETRIAMLRAETVDELFAILERAREAVRQVTD